LIATSGNISGAPVIYKDEDALEHLFDVADFILTYDRAIVTPQDDSVIQFTNTEQKIILRRSRGLAPNFFSNPFKENEEIILATGGELKSAFAFLNKKNLYISQYLGNLGNLESQESYRETLQHLLSLLQTQPEKVIVDKHPAYSVSQFGKQLSSLKEIPIFEVQHHKAHFGAVLAENNLLQIQEPVLGFIWDGTGYGDDQQIWGSELFLFEDREMKRVAHLDYFPQLLGDKMSKEPRLSALCLLKNFTPKQSIIQLHFSEAEWKYYQKVLQQNNQIYTSSMGRFLDGLACMLGIKAFNSYEGEAAMHMEVLARNCPDKSSEYYSLPLKDGILDWSDFLEAFLEDIEQKTEKSLIAWKVFYSLAKAVEKLSNHLKTDKLAFSGGAFQNSLLTDLITEELSHKKQLYFHQQLSPNDECIGFGQLACYQLDKESTLEHSENTLYLISDI
jgi:hydrogenase maturation protein HypF